MRVNDLEGSPAHSEYIINVRKYKLVLPIHPINSYWVFIVRVPVTLENSKETQKCGTGHSPRPSLSSGKRQVEPINTGS